MRNLPLICVEFGVGCAFRVLNAVIRGEKTTFLEVVFKVVPKPASLDAPQPLR